MTSDRDVVVIWRSVLLPGSETFIRNQAYALTRWRPAFLGAAKFDSVLARDTDVTPRGRNAFRRLRLTGGSPEIRSLLAGLRPAVVHAHFAGDGWLISRSAVRLGVPLIVTLHGQDVTRQAQAPGLRGWRYRRNLRTAFRRAALILAVSEFIAGRAIALGADPAKVRVHHTGVPAPTVEPPADKTWDVLFVGRFVAKKGLDDLIEALGEIREPRPRTLFIGGGPLEETIRKRAADLGLDATFRGPQDPATVAASMAASKIFAAPSKIAPNGDSEGLPTTIVEAARLGLPTVSTTHSGIPEAVVHGETGLLGAEGDRVALAANLRRLLTDDDLRIRLGDQAKAVADERFDLSRQTAMLEDLYDRVAAGGSVYLALGARRIQAAVRYAESAISPVTLVVATRAELEVPPGVTVHRFAPGQFRAVRRFLLAADGPLRDADLLIAGDPEAAAVAGAVGRRRPDLTIRLEPSPDPARRPAEAELAVVTPWYPAPDDPFAGAFVQASTAAVDVPRVAILHTQSWFYSPRGVRGQIVGVSAERLAARSGNAVVLDTAEGELTRVAVPTASGDTYPQYAEVQVNALRAALPTGRIEAPLVHAHTGMMGGVVAARLARPDARIVVTEHASFLRKLYAQPGGRRQYGEMLARVDALLCVSRFLYDQLSADFPEHAGKLRVVPNAIDFDRFQVRAAPPAEPLRWLYVGRLLEGKGVPTLVDAFALIAAEDPRVTLTLVGAGVLEESLAKRVASLGLGDRFTLRPPVPPEEIIALMHEHDLLVHASRFETFGMTVIEAVATGTPVLVARSQGPSETLAGLEDRAGLLFEPTSDPAVIATAYRELRARFDSLDLPGARAELLARYGFAAVAAQLREVYSAPRGERGPALRPPASRRALGQRLAACVSDPVPEAVLRRLHRIVRRVARSVRR